VLSSYILNYCVNAGAMVSCLRRCEARWFAEVSEALLYSALARTTKAEIATGDSHTQLLLEFERVMAVQAYEYSLEHKGH
jgi:hypothetical protein